MQYEMKWSKKMEINKSQIYQNMSLQAEKNEFQRLR